MIASGAFALARGTMSENSSTYDGERRRLATLTDYDVLAGKTEQGLDDITRIAAQVAGTPIAFISLVDDQRTWFKAPIGLDLADIPRAWSISSHAIEQDGVFEIPDLNNDDRFARNPLVTGEAGFRSYAGAPLVASDGEKLGTLAVVDYEPRQLNADQRQALLALSRQVMALLTARKQLADRRQVDQRHGFILDSAVDYAIVSMRLDGTVTSWNEGAVRIMGWTEQEMCGLPCHRFFTPEDCDDGIPEKEMGAALAQGRGKDERWHLRKGGERFWANGEMMPLTDEADRPIGFIKILRDRTEQRLEYERLKAIEERFKIALEAAGFVGSWDWDSRTDTLRADSKFCAFYSVDPELGESGVPLATFVAGIHPDDRERVAEAIRQCIAETGEFAEEYRVLRHDGAVRWVMAQGRCAYDGSGKATHFPGVAIDTTDRKLAELALADSETRMRLALEAGELGTWESTLELGNLQWDARTRELLGHTPDEPLDFQHSFIRQVHPDDRERVNAVVREAVTTDGMLDVGFRTIDAAGRQRHVHAIGAVVVGMAKRFLGTVRDVTELRAAEDHRALLNNELQHRIKNTLSIVQAIVSQSLRNASTPAEARDTIGNRLQVLSEAHDLLTRTSWSAAPIDTIVDGAIRLQGGRSRRIRVSGPQVRFSARAALALAMALHELGTNATKYGALSVPEGHVDLRWTVIQEAEPVFELVWKEHGGPVVTEPTRVGFGTRLMQSLGRDLGGKAVIDYEPSGVRWTVRSSLAAIVES
ncbi:PAS domain-containing protein [Sphingomonas sp. CV7422]|uniref:PAS domain-containing protein n=1 Tax=Sphingomonas sp. CV7422 TaxID=3018036 RepID=UPI0022FF25DB|nr:PAS domain-containing protein [Sphingomonas sp. CV7422]